MAGEAKITKKIVDETVNILKSVPEDKLDDVAARLGVDTDLVKASIKNPKSKLAKEFFTTSLEKVGKSLQGVQDLVDQSLGRAKPEAVELGTRRELGTSARPPAVQPEFAKEGLGKQREGRLQTVANKLGGGGPEAVENVALDAVTGAPKSRVIKAESVEPLALPPSPPPSKAAAAKAAGEVAEEAVTAPAVAAKPGSRLAKVGLGLGAAGAAAGGYKLFEKGFMQDEAVSPVVKESGIADTEDVKTIVDTIPEDAITPEQKTVIQDKTDKLTAVLKSLEQRIGAEQDAAKKERLAKESKLEMMRAIETIMHGVVSALGANALLNRGSPFAIDFSKGPQTDWTSEFNRLSKDYDTQMSGIISKYKLEVAEKKAEAEEAGREARFQKSLQLKEKELEQKGQEAGIKRTEQAALKAEKAQDKEAAAKDKAFAELSGALASLKEKSTPITTKQVVANATKLGIPKEEIDLLVSKTTGKGLFNLADENKVAEILEKYRPGQAAPAETGTVQVELNGQVGTIPADQVQAFLKKYPNAKVQE